MRIAQLVSNLVANAVSHGATGGIVNVNAVFDGPILEVNVSNKGDAIPLEILDRIFEPFIRNETEKARLGLGLGLYISSKIVDAHGGELKVHSDTDNTKFTVRIPRSRIQNAD